MGFGDADALEYRTAGIAPQYTQPASVVSQDEANYDTLKSVYLDMKQRLDDIDKWHAFDLKKNESDLEIKQQIYAHQVAYDILAPAFQALETAVATVDNVFLERQRG